MSLFTSISSCCSGEGDLPNKEYSTDDLKSNIAELHIGWTKLNGLKGNAISTLSFFTDGLTQFFVPSFMGGGRYFHHMFGWILLENGNSFLVEYDRNGYYIKKCSFEDFEKLCDHHYYFNGIDVSPPIQLTFENIKTLDDVIKKCNVFIKKKYKALGHSCQDFINIFIKETKAQRLKGDKGRGNHSAGVFGIPYVILKELEKNESDGANVIGYIPFLGTFIDSFRG
jgi:hypothetical protein